MWRATLAWRRQVAAALRPLDLTHVQFVLLASTWWLSAQSPQPGSQRELADFAGVDVMMTSQVLRTLESKGLVTRAADGKDSRTKLVRITAAGEQLARQAIEVVEGVDEDFFSVVDTDAALMLLQCLDRQTPAPSEGVE